MAEDGAASVLLPPWPKNHALTPPPDCRPRPDPPVIVPHRFESLETPLAHARPYSLLSPQLYGMRTSSMLEATMGREKEAIIERQDHWMMKARSEGLRCSVCSSTIPYDERDVFFETQMCGWCAHQDVKDA